MESAPMETNKQGLASSFLEIAVGQTAATAEQFLQATSWNLEEAILLFYVGNEGGSNFSASSAPPQVNIVPTGWGDDVSEESVTESEGENEVDGDVYEESIIEHAEENEVRPSLPVRRDTLYDDASVGRRGIPFRNIGEESRPDSVWESNSSTASTTNGSHDNLASLYSPPQDLMFHGHFHSAKVKGNMEDKWLLINLQSTKEFSSYMLNRDTWSNEAVAQIIRSNFIFWQADRDSDEGMKVCTYYKLDSVPAIVVIDPITGQKMHARSGMVQPDCLLEGLLPYMDSGPWNHDALPHKHLPHKHRREPAHPSSHNLPGKAAEDGDEKNLPSEEALTEAITEMSIEDNTSTAADDETTDGHNSQSSLNRNPMYLPLPEEPKGNRELLCRVKIRLPGGQSLQRAFLCTDPIKLLWSFCCTQVDEGESRPFYFTLALPGASRTLEYESNLTFEESRLSNSLLTLVWV